MLTDESEKPEADEKPIRTYELRVDSIAGKMTVIVEAALWEGPTDDGDAAWHAIADVVAERLKAL